MKKIIPSLNGLRAISIIMVIGYHLNEYGHFGNSTLVRYTSPLIFNGPLGVSVFFIISGFLITTLLKNEEEKRGTVSFKNFYFRRVIRIFPAYYFLLIVYAILQAFNVLKLTSNEWISSLTFTRQFFNGHDETGHLWSLSVEEFFYFIWPLFLIKFKNKSVNGVYVAIIVTLIIRFVAYKSPSIMNTIFSNGDGLLIGCLFAIKYNDITKWIANRESYIYILIAFLFISVLLNKYMSFLLINSNNSYITTLASICYSLFGNIGLFTNLTIAAIIIYSLVKDNNIWFKVLNSAVLNYIGKLSYSIYLWQQFFLTNKYFHDFSTFSLLLIIVLAALSSYYIIELPFLKLKRVFAV